MKHPVKAAKYCVDVFPSKAGEEMRRRSIRSEFIAHAQDDSLAGIAMIGWLTRMRRSISRKCSDVITNKGNSRGKPPAAYKRRS